MLKNLVLEFTVWFGDLPHFGFKGLGLRMQWFSFKVWGWCLGPTRRMRGSRVSGFVELRLKEAKGTGVCLVRIPRVRE